MESQYHVYARRSFDCEGREGEAFVWEQCEDPLKELMDRNAKLNQQLDRAEKLASSLSELNTQKDADAKDRVDARRYLLYI